MHGAAANRNAAARVFGAVEFGAPNPDLEGKTVIEFEGVVPALAQALNKRGYTELTPVQSAVLDPEVREADILVSAQTGSGKTAAFGIAFAPTLLGDAARFPAYVRAPLALVVAPTRELAMQVRGELEWLYAETGAVVASCVGGMDMRTERRVLDRGVHMVVGTPGRLRDHIERGSLDLGGIRVVVLDEADEMLDLGFREDLEYILDAAPAERRTMLFSATVPQPIVAMAKRYQRDAVRISTVPERQAHGDIDYRAYQVAPNDRENAIINVLRYFEARSALVFCATRATVNHMTSRFANRGFSVVALSGELSQNERSHALQAMRDGRARVCIATDVAARGIDLPNLELVIHADVPKSRESLVHRSGRTGRAGQKGTSVLIVPHTWRRRTERLLQTANIRAYWSKPPSVDDVMRRDDERLLADPSLAEPVQEDEREFVRRMLETHDAERIAAAFVRLYRAGRSAPEELLDAAAPEPKPKARDDFKDGVWFRLSVGRNQSAEPRWLLPMLCRVGHITKNEIGAIRVQDDETHVELAPGCVERFLEGVGPGYKVEKTIALARMDGPPPVSMESSEHPEAPKKPFARKRRGGGEGGPPKRPFRKSRRDHAADDALCDDTPPPAKAKRSYASPFAKGGAKGRKVDPSGTKPLRRKKPKKTGAHD